MDEFSQDRGCGYPENLLSDIFSPSQVPTDLNENVSEELDELIRALPDQERAALICRYKEQRSAADLPAALGLTRAAADAAVKRGLRLLRHPARYRSLMKCGPDSGQTDAPNLVVVSAQFPVGGMGLGMNALRCLLRHGVRTVGDILALSPEELTQIPGLGSKSYQEVVGRLRLLGYCVVPIDTRPK